MTAYEFRIGDWSAYVCSSDLGWRGIGGRGKNGGKVKKRNKQRRRLGRYRGAVARQYGCTGAAQYRGTGGRVRAVIAAVAASAITLAGSTGIGRHCHLDAHFARLHGRQSHAQG